MKNCRIMFVVGGLTVVPAACGDRDEAAKSVSSQATTSQAISVEKYDVPSDALPLTIDAIAGPWTVGTKTAFIKVVGSDVSCVNENGLPSKAVLKDGKVIFATDWRVYGWLLANGTVLKWSDGSAWTR